MGLWEDGRRLRQELTETKQVLGDLLQERVVGLKVYALFQFGYLKGIFINIDAAQRAGGPGQEWKEFGAEWHPVGGTNGWHIREAEIADFHRAQ